jgi:hypothetical protein
MSSIHNGASMDFEDEDVFVWSGSGYVTDASLVDSSFAGPAAEYNLGLEAANSNVAESFVSYCPQMDPTSCFVPDLVFAEGAHYLDPCSQFHFGCDASLECEGGFMYGDAWMNNYPSAEQMHFTEPSHRASRNGYVQQLNPKLEDSPAKKRRDEAELAKQIEQAAVGPALLTTSPPDGRPAGKQAAATWTLAQPPQTATLSAVRAAKPVAEAPRKQGSSEVPSVRRGISRADKQRLESILKRAARTPVLSMKDDTARSAASTTDDVAKESDARSVTTDDVTKESDTRSVTTDDVTKDSDMRSVTTDDVAKESDAPSFATNDVTKDCEAHDAVLVKEDVTKDSGASNDATVDVATESDSQNATTHDVAKNSDTRTLTIDDAMVALRDRWTRSPTSDTHNSVLAEEHSVTYSADVPVPPIRKDRDLCGLCAEPVPSQDEKPSLARCSIM